MVATRLHPSRRDRRDHRPPPAAASLRPRRPAASTSTSYPHSLPRQRALRVLPPRRLERLGLRFPEQVRPNFEDGHFCSLLPLAWRPPGGRLRRASPEYLYRKRGDRSFVARRRSMARPGPLHGRARAMAIWRSCDRAAGAARARPGLAAEHIICYELRGTSHPGSARTTPPSVVDRGPPADAVPRPDAPRSLRPRRPRDDRESSRVRRSAVERRDDHCCTPTATSPGTPTSCWSTSSTSDQWLIRLRYRFTGTHPRRSSY